jgi:hypothetical protein
VKQGVSIAWKKEQQAEAVKRYFKRMRTGATVEILRP